MVDAIWHTARMVLFAAQLLVIIDSHLTKFTIPTLLIRSCLCFSHLYACCYNLLENIHKNIYVGQWESTGMFYLI